MNTTRDTRRAHRGRKIARHPAIRNWLALPGRTRRGKLSRRLRRRRIPASIWSEVAQLNRLMARFDRVARLQLRILASEVLWQKTLSPGRGMILNEVIKAQLAGQIAIVLLGLENTEGYSRLVWLRNWREIIVYPAPFRPRRQQVTPIGGNPLGLVLHTDPVELGETSYQGPLIVIWPQTGSPRASGLALIHELAHKLDMLDGSSNGHPPLHATMDHQVWRDTFQSAFLHLNRRLDAGHAGDIDPYAATSPAEFFAVCSEYFFADPEPLYITYPEVYHQLCLFYRQHPLPVYQRLQMAD